MLKAKVMLQKFREFGCQPIQVKQAVVRLRSQKHAVKMPIRFCGHDGHLPPARVHLSAHPSIRKVYLIPVFFSFKKSTLPEQDLLVQPMIREPRLSMERDSQTNLAGAGFFGAADDDRVAEGNPRRLQQLARRRLPFHKFQAHAAHFPLCRKVLRRGTRC